MSKPWISVGNWALEAERAEAEERAAALDAQVQGFPTLKKKKRGILTFSHVTSEERERPRLVLDPPKRDCESRQEAARSRANPFSAARPREVVLAEKVGMKKVGGITNSCSSRPGSSGSQAEEEGGVEKPRAKVNPFGDAKPREVVLEEKGLDWRKIDEELEHRRIDRLIFVDRYLVTLLASISIICLFFVGYLLRNNPTLPGDKILNMLISNVQISLVKPVL